MKTNNKVIIDLTHYSTATKEATATITINTPERPSPNKRVRVSHRIAALVLKEHHGVVANKEKDEKVDDDDGTTTTRPQYYEQQASNSSGDNDNGNHTNGYFEVDEILDRRIRKYGSESSAGVRYVVEYCKFVCVCVVRAHVVWMLIVFLVAD